MNLPISEFAVGKHYSELPTPCLCVDLDIFDYNIQAMKGLLAGTNCNLRPHFKAHKSTAVAHIQMKNGAIGISCAKLGEAEVLAHSGIGSILLTNQTIGEAKIRVLCGLNRYSEVITAVDDKKNAEEINKVAKELGLVVPVVIEVDTGLNRSGVRSIEEAVSLTSHICSLSNLTFKGIQAYEGAFRGMSDREKAAKCDGTGDIGGVAFAVEVRKAIEAVGVPVEIVSCSSTGTCAISIHMEGITEIQPGSYIVMETAYYRDNDNFPFKEAMYLPSTICSINKPNKRIVIDCGKKATPYDQGLPILIEDPTAKLIFHEEHCLIDATEKLTSYNIGDVLRLAPSHCCTTANLHDIIYCTRNGFVEQVWPVNARGRYQ
ncbi:MAG: DSD1 family PLP-dependent enzyme [Bacillota bacterium]